MGLPDSARNNRPCRAGSVLQLKSYYLFCMITIPDRTFSTLQGDDGCVIRTSIQTPYGVQQTLQLWNATFVDYLTDQLSDELGCSFELVPLMSVDNAYDVVKYNQTDFLFMSPGIMHCIEVWATSNAVC